MDAQQMIAFIMYVLANVAVTALKIRGYARMISYFSLMFVGFMAVNSMQLGEIAYLIIALLPMTLFLGDVLHHRWT